MRITITKKQAEKLFKRFGLLVIDLNETGWLYEIGDDGAPMHFASAPSIEELIKQIGE